MNKHGYWIGLLLSLIFLAFFFRKIDLGSIWHTFQNVEYLYTIPLILINVATIWIRAERWRYLLAPIKQVTIGPLFKATAIGFMANSLLPARLGELVRAYVLGSKEKISKTASFATIVVERVFDGFVILLLFLVVIFFMPFPSGQSSFLSKSHIQMLGYLSLFFYLAVLGMLLLLRFYNEKANRIIGFFLKFLPENLSDKILKVMESFVSGLQILHRTKDILVVTGYSLILWVITSLSLCFLFKAFHLPLPVLAAFFLEVILCFGVSIPSAPGYIGTFHWACAAALIFLGIEANIAKSFALLLWFLTFLPVTFLGLFSLWIEGMSLGQLKDTELKG